MARPPLLCAGCPHRGVFYALAKRKDVFVSGDIGCYGLGAMPPLSAVDTILCMGASVSGGHGAAKAMEDYGDPMHTVSVIGDSTFFHSGMTSLLNVVYNNSRIVTIILDNRITGMTGHQDHPGSGYNAQGEPAKEADIETIVRALGVEHVQSVNPLRLDEMDAALDRAIGCHAPAVIIARWPCALLKRKYETGQKEVEQHARVYAVQVENCVGCGLCTKIGCPAIRLDKAARHAAVDAGLCRGCSLCAQVCPAQCIQAIEEG